MPLKKSQKRGILDTLFGGNERPKEPNPNQQPPSNNNNPSPSENNNGNKNTSPNVEKQQPPQDTKPNQPSNPQQNAQTSNAQAPDLPPITSTIIVPPPSATSAAAKPTSSANQKLTSGTITSTLIVQPSAAPNSEIPGADLTNPSLPPSAAVKPQSQDDGKGQLMTAGIAIGCVVVAAAIGIWVFRKWKLSPSRSFREKVYGNDSPGWSARSKDMDKEFLRQLRV
ncbi:uncharacterized protein VTP21DRAFT_125 [Calcarisporiella thermophila]|uniref:uncharacterized protein n=1 Tax=Calcarisporiella thermophila TaxID=911321 RepID=UPI00374461AA